MVPHPDKSAGKEIVTHWDGRDFFGRLQMVLDNRQLFWSLGLITTSELEMVTAMSESAREYVIDREDQPFFESIHLKKDIETQNHRDKLESALRAVFVK
jgi:hypothetical protein